VRDAGGERVVALPVDGDAAELELLGEHVAKVAAADTARELVEAEARGRDRGGGHRRPPLLRRS
jgi:hypothetical protein